jgi:hypothetical protein
MPDTGPAKAARQEQCQDGSLGSQGGARGTQEPLGLAEGFVCYSFIHPMPA